MHPVPLARYLRLRLRGVVLLPLAQVCVCVYIITRRKKKGTTANGKLFIIILYNWQYGVTSFIEFDQRRPSSYRTALQIHRWVFLN